MKAIQTELGEADEQAAEVEEFRKRIEAAVMPEEAEKQARRELDRLARLPTAAAEYGVIRTYLDWLVSLPWAKTTQDNLDIAHARAVLDEDHYALQDVKGRILEYLAVRKLRLERKDEAEAPTDNIRRERRASSCALSPSGRRQDVSGALDRPPQGGVHPHLLEGSDEAEIRGHRRTPSALSRTHPAALRRASSRNPVFMLDEVDKLGQTSGAIRRRRSWSLGSEQKASSVTTISRWASISPR
jgi:ATP-dependent Lon protease